ncbi:hypothetical protein BDZ91DRAFT_797247 [Kalaharituber pfeilii]|nr:hypothetical protein BDZ91DRAFT_797247 [Kalaharituber pfeilii]
MRRGIPYLVLTLSLLSSSAHTSSFSSLAIEKHSRSDLDSPALESETRARSISAHGNIHPVPHLHQGPVSAPVPVAPAKRQNKGINNDSQQETVWLTSYLTSYLTEYLTEYETFWSEITTTTTEYSTIVHTDEWEQPTSRTGITTSSTSTHATDGTFSPVATTTTSEEYKSTGQGGGANTTTVALVALTSVFGAALTGLVVFKANVGMRMGIRMREASQQGMVHPQPPQMQVYAPYTPQSAMGRRDPRLIVLGAQGHGQPASHGELVPPGTPVVEMYHELGSRYKAELPVENSPSLASPALGMGVTVPALTCPSDPEQKLESMRAGTAFEEEMRRIEEDEAKLKERRNRLMAGENLE